AGSVGTDERHLGTLAHAERDVGEEHAPVRQGVRQSGDIDVSHGSPIVGGTAPGPRSLYRWARPIAAALPMRPLSLGRSVARPLQDWASPARTRSTRYP